MSMRRLKTFSFFMVVMDESKSLLESTHFMIVVMSRVSSKLSRKVSSLFKGRFYFENQIFFSLKKIIKFLLGIEERLLYTPYHNDIGAYEKCR